MNKPLAHSGGHLLADHLHSVSKMAGELSNKFDSVGFSQRWGALAGKWHDLGKYRPGFQRYLRQTDDPDTHIERKVGGREKTHSVAGALWAMQKFEVSHGKSGALAARALAYLIAGHHAGLDDWHGGLKERLAQDECKVELNEALAAMPPECILNSADFVPDLIHIPGGSAGFALWVRLLFSSLVDADFLDTEAHFDAGKPARREGFPTVEQLLFAFDTHMLAVSKGVPPSPVNSMRAEVLRQCREKATLSGGVFSLTVPTGGGKTLSGVD